MEDQQAFVLRAPLGQLYFQLRVEGYSPVHRTETLHAGRNEITVRMRRDDMGVEIVLKDGSAVVPWPNRSWAELKGRGHEGKVGGSRGHGRISVTGPGEYTLTLHLWGDTGFKPPKPRVVRVPSGEWARIEIPLQK